MSLSIWPSAVASLHVTVLRFENSRLTNKENVVPQNVVTRQNYVAKQQFDAKVSVVDTKFIDATGKYSVVYCYWPFLLYIYMNIIGIVHPFINTHVIPNLYDFFFCRTQRYFEEC